MKNIIAVIVLAAASVAWGQDNPLDVIAKGKEVFAISEGQVIWNGKNMAQKRGQLFFQSNSAGSEASAPILRGGPIITCDVAADHSTLSHCILSPNTQETLDKVMSVMWKAAQQQKPINLKPLKPSSASDSVLP
jgi:hypothetical protein